MKNRLLSTKSDTLRGGRGGRAGFTDLGHKKASKQQHDLQYLYMTNCREFSDICDTSIQIQYLNSEKGKEGTLAFQNGQVL